MKLNPHIPRLAEDFGIVFPGAMDYRTPAMDRAIVMDAAPTNVLQNQLVTVGNAGIPAYLTNFLDPKLTRVLTTPCKAAQILGERKVGDWTMETAMFPMIESVGEVSSYGDYNNNGMADVNAQFEGRSSYGFQAITQWGDKEIDHMSLAKIDLASEKNISCAKLFEKALNRSYFFGVTNLANYGLLNDPALSPSLAPTGAWSGLTGVQIFADISRLFSQLMLQMPDMISKDDDMVLAMSSGMSIYLEVPMQNVYGTTTVADVLKKTFPGMEIITASEYTTTAGEVVQLIAKSVLGQETGYCAFTEKMRAHAIVRETSYTKQKKSAGTWGAIIKLPAAIASMIGV